MAKTDKPKGWLKLSYKDRKRLGWIFHRETKEWVKHRQVRHREKREPRSIIISFRLRASESDSLKRDMEANPSAGVKSLKQFARKLCIDYARGRMVYIDLLDRKIDPYSRDNIDRLSPNCAMSDRAFLRSLVTFLNVGENWRKLDRKSVV